MIYLLDTNACITILRGRNVMLVQRVAAHLAAEIRLCSVVVAELYYGAYRSANPRAEGAKVVRFIRRFRSLPFNRRAAKEAGRIRADLGGPGHADRPLRSPAC